MNLIKSQASVVRNYNISLYRERITEFVFSQIKVVFSTWTIEIF